MSEIILFYKNNSKINNYVLRDIIYKWDNNKLKKEEKYIKYLFPEKVTPGELEIIMNDKDYW